MFVPRIPSSLVERIKRRFNNHFAIHANRYNGGAPKRVFMFAAFVNTSILEAQASFGVNIGLGNVKGAFDDIVDSLRMGWY